MNSYKIYQTVEDKDDADKISNEGPFCCNRSDAWLGKGYYFWESFIENAKWWGYCAYCGKEYVICEASYVNNDKQCFNLVDNPIHLQFFRDAITMMRTQGLYKPKVTTVSRVIQFLKDIDLFPYNATRAKPEACRSFDSEFSFTTFFLKDKGPYLDTLPPIQICFYRKSAPLDLSNYKIVYPLKYIE